MIRTKDDLIAALADGSRLYGCMGTRPSSPWKYTIKADSEPEVVVHGLAFWAAEKAGLITKVRGDWNSAVYRLNRVRSAQAV